MTGHRTSQFSLLKTRRFLPLFLVQGLGAFNDNLFKSVIVVLITYGGLTIGGMEPEMLVSLSAALFVLPFFLFSAIAGQMADAYDRSRLIQRLKLCEIGIMGLAAFGFALKSLPLLLLALFLMGTQSAFFGPLKWGVLPDLLEPHELVSGNGLANAMTFLAILAGTIAGTVLIGFDSVISIVIAGCLGIALAGYCAARAMPRLKPANPSLQVQFNLVRETVLIVKRAANKRVLFRSVLGICWFWFLGSVYYILLPIFTKDVLGGDTNVVALFLAAYSIGIAIGSLLCHQLGRGLATELLVPLGAFGLTLFGIDFYFASAGELLPEAGQLIGLDVYFQSADRLRIFADLAGMAVSGGLFTIPLYTQVQKRSGDDDRSRMFAALNVLNAFGMVCASVFIMVLTGAGLPVRHILLAAALLNIPIGILIIRVTAKGLYGALMRRIHSLS